MSGHSFLIMSTTRGGAHNLGHYELHVSKGDTHDKRRTPLTTHLREGSFLILYFLSAFVRVPRGERETYIFNYRGLEHSHESGGRSCASRPTVFRWPYQGPW